jgi:small-conductance mechanosensitive channel
MTHDVSLGEPIARTAMAMVDRTVAFLPSVLGAVLLLLFGWILAKVLRAVTTRGLQALDAALARLLSARIAQRVPMARSAGALAAIVFWAVMLFFIAAAAQLLGLQVVTLWLERLLDYLPTLVAGLLIVVAGYVMAGVVANLVLNATGRFAEAQRVVIARTVQATILVGALLVGADQIGIKVTFLAIFVGAAAVAVGGGAIAAVSLGARTHVANLIGGLDLQRNYELGNLIRVRGYEGRILEMTANAVVLETSDGRVRLPGRIFTEEPVETVTRGRNG